MRPLYQGLGCNPLYQAAELAHGNTRGDSTRGMKGCSENILFTATFMVLSPVTRPWILFRVSHRTYLVWHLY